jgi:energy-coupling factor transporter ATP-binding protein EcfA2
MACRATRCGAYRAKVQAVFQDPWSSLDPRMKVGRTIAESLIVNGGMDRAAIDRRVRELLLQVGLRPEQAEQYPHEFSGGQRQRVALAAALASRPKLIVLDEPVSALDVSIRAQMMNLLKDIQARDDVAYLLVAHDLATVRHMADHTVVMYLGKIVERAPTAALFADVRHPYTRRCSPPCWSPGRDAARATRSSCAARCPRRSTLPPAAVSTRAARGPCRTAPRASPNCARWRPVMPWPVICSTRRGADAFSAVNDRQEGLSLLRRFPVLDQFADRVVELGDLHHQSLGRNVLHVEAHQPRLFRAISPELDGVETVVGARHRPSSPPPELFSF